MAGQIDSIKFFHWMLLNVIREKASFLTFLFDGHKNTYHPIEVGFIENTIIETVINPMQRTLQIHNIFQGGESS